METKNSSRTSLYSPLLNIIPAVGCFLNLGSTEKEYSDDQTGVVQVIKLAVILLLIGNMYLRSYVYIETAVIVVVSYLSLLMINAKFIVLVFFPLVALGFIVALRSALMISRGNGRGDAAAGSGSGSTGVVTDDNDKKGETAWEEAEQLKAMSVGPYLVLAVMGRLSPDSFAVSRFLLFLSNILGTLMLMMIRLPAGGAAPGVQQASELLRKTSLVVLLVTVHAMAAELLREKDLMLLFVMPELVPAMLWFSLSIDGGSAVVTVGTIKYNRSGLVFLGAAAAVGTAYLAASMDESGVSTCMIITVSCAVSGLLVLYVVFMLRLWPEKRTATAAGGVSYLEEAVSLLKFWAIFLLLVAAASLVSASVAAVRLGLHEKAAPALAIFLNDYYV